MRAREQIGGSASTEIKQPLSLETDQTEDCVSVEYLEECQKRFNDFLAQPRLKNDRIMAENYKTDISSDSFLNKYRGTFFTVLFRTLEDFVENIRNSRYFKNETIVQDVGDLETSFIKFFHEYKKTRQEQRQAQVEELKADKEFVEIVARGLGKSRGELDSSDWGELLRSILPTGNSSFFQGRISEEDLTKIVEKFRSTTKKYLNTLDGEIDQADVLLVAARKLVEKIIKLDADKEINYHKSSKTQFKQPYAR